MSGLPVVLVFLTLAGVYAWWAWGELSSDNHVSSERNGE